MVTSWIAYDLPDAYPAADAWWGWAITKDGLYVLAHPDEALRDMKKSRSGLTVWTARWRRLDAVRAVRADLLRDILEEGICALLEGRRMDPPLEEEWERVRLIGRLAVFPRGAHGAAPPDWCPVDVIDARELPCVAEDAAERLVAAGTCILGGVGVRFREFLPRPEGWTGAAAWALRSACARIMREQFLARAQDAGVEGYAFALSTWLPRPRPEERAWTWVEAGSRCELRYHHSGHVLLYIEEDRDICPGARVFAAPAGHQHADGPFRPAVTAVRAAVAAAQSTGDWAVVRAALRRELGDVPSPSEELPPEELAAA